MSVIIAEVSHSLCWCLVAVAYNLRANLLPENNLMALLNRRAWMAVACVCLLSSWNPLSAGNYLQGGAARQSPVDALRSAQTIYIRSNSVYFKASTLENSLLQQEEFQRWGLVITRDESDADLVIEVGRKVFTTSFIYTVIDPRNRRVIASGRVNSIGGTVEGKITDSFMKKLRAARQAPSANQMK